MQIVGLRVLRLGYSFLEPHTHLKPHYGKAEHFCVCLLNTYTHWNFPRVGMTNAQLKLHFGVTVPTSIDGAPCAWLRVHNETRPWTQDGTLYFDDSFQHEVLSWWCTYFVVS